MTQTCVAQTLPRVIARCTLPMLIYLYLPAAEPPRVRRPLYARFILPLGVYPAAEINNVSPVMVSPVI